MEPETYVLAFSSFLMATMEGIKSHFSCCVIKQWIKTCKELVISCLIMCDRSCQVEESGHQLEGREVSELWRCFPKLSPGKQKPADNNYLLDQHQTGFFAEEAASHGLTCVS